MSEFLSSLDKKALIILTLEVSVVIFIIAFLLIIFSRYSIFPFKTSSQTPTTVTNSSQTNANITTNSNVPGYELQLENKEELIKILDDWGIFGTTALMNSTGSTNTPIENIVIQLELNNTQASPSVPGAQTTQSKMGLSSGTVTYSLFLTKNQLESNYYDSTKLLDIILPRFYLLTNPIGSLGNAESNKKITDAKTALESKYPVYFTITKL